MLIRSLLLATFVGTAAQADEGMWLPSQAPQLAPILKERGLALDPARLSDLGKAPLNAIASLGGCSASFVSPQGLVVTNHHCVYGSVQYNSKPGRDYLADGFLAADGVGELPAAPGSRIYVIEDLRDVTAAMARGIGPRMSGLARNLRSEANRKALIAACERKPSRRCDVRGYYGGSTWYLQQQFEIQDVRLVYAPASGIGNFGGETDNWQWPRHTGDWGFYRAYVAPDGRSAPYAKENVPYRSRSWLKVAAAGPKEGDLVIVAGFPGETERLKTAAEARFAFTTYLPEYQRFLSDYSDVIARATAGDEAATIKYASIIRGADNYKKNTAGQLAGAEAIDLIGRKAAAEKAYREWIAADPARAPYAAAAKALDATVVEADQAALDELWTSALGRAQLLQAARVAYRWAREQAKPDGARDPGYQDRDRRATVERLTQVERRFDPKVDRAILEQALALYGRVSLARQDAAFLAKQRAIGLDRLYAATKLADTATRVGWLDQPVAAFEASTDPFIQLAVAMSPADQKARDEARDLAGRDIAARAVYLSGLKAFTEAGGRPLSADANGSLRFTYGTITGRQRDGMAWAPFTSLAGILEKQTGRGEFAAPERQITAIKAGGFGRFADPATGSVPVNFLSTVDTTGGNSGSATLNERGEMVGLLFDGTLDGVISDWWYDARINRSIHVDVRYMLWTMAKVDGAGRLLDEMGVAR